MKTDELVHRRYDSPADDDAIARILADAFGGSEAGMLAWLTQSGHANVRVLVEGNTPVGCYLRVPMGQFFGGRSVPIVGLAGVAVALEARGRGLGRAMMRAALVEIAKEPVALSVLYPSTQALYRAVGFERAGRMVEVRVPTDAFATSASSSLAARPLREPDEAAVEALYRTVAAGRAGHLDRGPYVWHRVRAPRRDDGRPARGFGFFDAAARLRAYAYFVIDFDDPGGFYTVRLTDVQALDDEGFTALTRWLASLRSMGRTISFRAAPSSPLLMRLSEPRYVETSKEDWMVRVVDVKRALTSRGYAFGLDQSFVVSVSDDMLPANQSTFHVAVARGRARVVRAPRETRADLTLDARALGPLITGYLGISDLASLGLVHASRTAIARLSGVFSTGAPAMSDMF